MNTNYVANNYNEAAKEIIGFNRIFNGLIYLLKPHINDRIFETSYRIYVFDTR